MLTIYAPVRKKTQSRASPRTCTVPTGLPSAQKSPYTEQNHKEHGQPRSPCTVSQNSIAGSQPEQEAD